MHLAASAGASYPARAALIDMKTWVFSTFLIMALCAANPRGWAQGCETRDEIQPDVRTAIDSAAQKTFDQASRGDVNGLRESAILSLQSSFNGVSAAINDNKAALTGAKAQVRTGFVLDTGNPPPTDGRFYC